MAWEMRKSKVRYFYRSERRKGRVIKRYVGPESDPTAQVIALAARLEMSERKASRLAYRKEWAAYEESDALLVELFARGETLTTAILLRAGYERKRCHWRKRRLPMPQPDQSQVPSSAPTQEEFHQIVRLANAGDANALVQLREILDHYPSVWRQFADLASHVEESLIKLISTKNKLLQESLRQKVRQMKVDLHGDSTSPLETGVVERIVACWLQVQFAEIASVEHAKDDKAAYWQKRLDQTQRRYLAATNSLATIRKLAAK